MWTVTQSGDVWIAQCGDKSATFPTYEEAAAYAASKNHGATTDSGGTIKIGS